MWTLPDLKKPLKSRIKCTGFCFLNRLSSHCIYDLLLIILKCGTHRKLFIIIDFLQNAHFRGSTEKVMNIQVNEMSI